MPEENIRVTIDFAIDDREKEDDSKKSIDPKKGAGSVSEREVLAQKQKLEVEQTGINDTVKQFKTGNVGKLQQDQALELHNMQVLE